jgi:hypothetical protein
METLIGILTMAGIVLLILLANSYIGFSNMLKASGTVSTTLVTA